MIIFIFREDEKALSFIFCINKSKSCENELFIHNTILVIYICFVNNVYTCHACALFIMYLLSLSTLFKINRKIQYYYMVALLKFNLQTLSYKNCAYLDILCVYVCVYIYVC